MRKSRARILVNVTVTFTKCYIHVILAVASYHYTYNTVLSDSTLDINGVYSHVSTRWTLHYFCNTNMENMTLIMVHSSSGITVKGNPSSRLHGRAPDSPPVVENIK